MALLCPNFYPKHPREPELGDLKRRHFFWNDLIKDSLLFSFFGQVFVLLFIFVKRQIMRFAMKSRRGPHVPVGHNAPKVGP